MLQLSHNLPEKYIYIYIYINIPLYNSTTKVTYWMLLVLRGKKKQKKQLPLPGSRRVEKLYSEGGG
jgi:hypothetical protein